MKARNHALDKVNERIREIYDRLQSSPTQELHDKYILSILDALNGHIRKYAARTLQIQKAGDFDDYLSAGQLAVIEAADRYDPHQSRVHSYFDVHIKHAMYNQASIVTGISTYYLAKMSRGDPVPELYSSGSSPAEMLDELTPDKKSLEDRIILKIDFDRAFDDLPPEDRQVIGMTYKGIGFHQIMHITHKNARTLSQQLTRAGLNILQKIS